MSSHETNVLLIEDNPGDAELASIMLGESTGGSFHLETRERLTSGLQRVAQGGIDALLLDLSLPDSQGLATFQRAHAAAPELPIVVVSSLDDEQIAMRAVENGAQDYLVKGGIDSPSLTRALLFAVERQRQQLAATRGRRGKIFCFVGAKGGSGTTTVALNVATAIAQTGKNVIAVELRHNFGTFALYLGCTPSVNLRHLLQVSKECMDEVQIASVLTEFPSGLRVLFGPQAIKECGEVTRENTETLLNRLTTMADYVVVDLPEATSGGSQVAARLAKFVAIVLSNDPVSVACGKRVLEELCAAGSSRPLLKIIAVNRSAAIDGMRVDEIAIQLGAEVLGMVVPATDLCLKAEKAGSPLVLLKPNHQAAQVVYTITQKLLAADGVDVYASMPPSVSA